MARNPVCLSVQFKVKTASVSFKFRSVVVAVFERIAVEYSYRISSLFATQFTVEKSNSVECFAMIFKKLFLWDNFKLCTKFHTGKTVLETFTRELNALT